MPPDDLTLRPGRADDLEFLYPVARGDSWVGYLRRLEGTPDLVSRVDVATGAIEVFTPTASKSSAPIGFTSSGAQVFAHGSANGPNLKIVWPMGRPAFALQSPALPGFVLP